MHSVKIKVVEIHELRSPRETHDWMSPEWRKKCCWKFVGLSIHLVFLWSHLKNGWWDWPENWNLDVNRALRQRFRGKSHTEKYEKCINNSVFGVSLGGGGGTEKCLQRCFYKFPIFLRLLTCNMARLASYCYF